MKQCPRCNRTFADDLSYCLDDGTPLVGPDASEDTLVRPRPESQPSQRSTKAVVVGVLGTILVVLLWGGIKLILWKLDHQADSGPTVATSTPTPAYDPLTLLASPSPTPSVSPSPSPTPSASPVESLISPGTYVFETTRAVDPEKQHVGTIRLRVTFNDNGTYFQQTFISIPEKDVDNLLSAEEKGKYSQVEDELVLSDRESHEFDMEDGWSPWSTQTVKGAMREKVRNVTANTFQIYESDEHEWFTFSRTS